MALKPQKLVKHLLFIDPASISSGWAYFKSQKLEAHGSVVIAQKMEPFLRLMQVYYSYLELANSDMGQRIQEVHIEQLPRRCHIYTHYSVAVAGIAFASSDCQVWGDIPVKAWQKHTDWHGERAMLKGYDVQTEDELAAIGMGLYYVNKK